VTFDLTTSKFIGVIYWVWPTFLPSTMTVTQKLFKILSGHGFCIKCYGDLDIWPIDLKIYRGHLLSMANLPTKYHDCHSETFQDIERTWFFHKMLLWPWHLTYWPQNLGHLLSMANLPTKYHDCHSETFQDIERTWCG